MRPLIALLTLIALGVFSSCTNGEEKVDSLFYKEFFVKKKECYGRFFYENAISGEAEYELYCEEEDKVNLTEKKDSILIKNEIETITLSSQQFVNQYGKPCELIKIPRNEIRFTLDTLVSIEDSSMQGEQNKIQKINIQVATNEGLLFNQVFNCNKVIMFDSSNISVYYPESDSNLFIVDGIEPLTLEMAYYDELGEFAGWEQMTSDIRSIGGLLKK